MTRHAAAISAFLTLLGPAVAIDPDPAKLAPTAEQADRAKQLAAKLGDPVFQVRDDATRELRKLGRAALPVLADTLDTTADPEVRNRCETLLPAVRDADLKARLAVFLADADGKFDHDLPAWDAFREVAGNTAAARQLYADACRTKVNVELLRAHGRPTEAEPLVLARRAQLYSVAIRVANASTTRTPSPADVAALLFAEAGVTITNRTNSYALTSLMTRPHVRDALTAPAGEPLRKLLAHWMDTRTNPLEISQALSLAGLLNFKEFPVGKYAERVLTTAGTAPTTRMIALTTAARVGGKDVLPVLAKGMADKTAHTVTWFVNGQRTAHEIQVRDIALVMSLILTDQKVEDFGVEVKNRPAGLAGNDVLKFSYLYYAFPTEKARDAGFAKWDQLKAKVKPAEKK
jgi:hypothetical protein